ncbi:MAG: hypothetical protein U0174_01830 [Polyangiaceae bacterium]
MKNFTAATTLASTLFVLAALPLAGCAADASPSDQGATQDPLGGTIDSTAKVDCSQYSPSQQKCEAQTQCVYDKAKSACIDAPRPAPGPGPAPAQDPCTEAFGKDQKLCEASSPKCVFDVKQNVCVYTGGSPTPSTTKCASYGADAKLCLADAACTFDRAKNQCIDGGSTTVSPSPSTTAVDAYCTQTYGNNQAKCVADAKCVFDGQRQMCRGR